MRCLYGGLWFSGGWFFNGGGGWFDGVFGCCGQRDRDKDREGRGKRVVFF